MMKHFLKLNKICFINCTNENVLVYKSLKLFFNLHGKKYLVYKKKNWLSPKAGYNSSLKNFSTIDGKLWLQLYIFFKPKLITFVFI